MRKMKIKINDCTDCKKEETVWMNHKLFLARNITVYLMCVCMLCMLLGGIWYNALNIQQFVNHISGIVFENDIWQSFDGHMVSGFESNQSDISGKFGSGGQKNYLNTEIEAYYSGQMIALNMNSGEIVSEKDSNIKIYPASLTKMMTALVSIEIFENQLNYKNRMNDVEDLLQSTKIEITEDMIIALQKENASMAGFEAGEIVTAKDMLYGMMLSSGADGAVGLACELCGSEDAFVQQMNLKAKSLGMLDTHFTNVTGLHDDNHYSTLKDLSVLLQAALKNEMFRKVFTTGMYETESTNKHPEGLVFESTLFRKMSVNAMEDVFLLGGKTGFTDEAGLCLATLASCNQQEYILITAGAKARNASQAFHIIDALHFYTELTRDN